MSRSPTHPARRRRRRCASALAMVVALGVLPFSGVSADEARTETPVPPPARASLALEATSSLEAGSSPRTEVHTEVHAILRVRGAGPRASGRRIGRAELDRSSILQIVSRRVRSRVRFDGLRTTVRSDRVLRPRLGSRERSSAAVTRRALRAARTLRSVGAALRHARSGALSSYSTTRPPPTRD